MTISAERRNIIVNRWVARVIPVVLAGVVGYATYVVVALLCVDYLLGKHNNSGAVIPILIFYFVLFLLMASSFFRLTMITALSPPFVPLGPAAIRDRQHQSRKHGRNGIGSREYSSGNRTESVDSGAGNTDADSPGLESFYTRDVFVCEWDGKPKWCSTCANWKPDRAHHCSSSGRCIYKMDHFCPWVGGPIGENNFKFFLQFTAYTALFCLHVLVIMAVYVRKQNSTQGERINNHFIATLALAAFFGLFTAGMTATSIELAVRNLTQVERLGIRTRVQILAVLKPPHLQPLQPHQNEHDIATRDIVYPLGAGSAPPRDVWRTSELTPSARTNDHIVQAESTFNSIATNQQTSIPDEQIPSTSANPGEQSELPAPSEPFSRDISSGSTTVEVPESSAPGNHWPSEEIAARDQKATRTFAVLKVLEQGDNPWDLGSALLNWKSLMGMTVLDWFLPIRRSPCSNHEEGESYYPVGPAVDRLRAHYKFIPESEIRGGRRIKDPTPPEVADVSPSEKGGHRKRRRRKHHSGRQKSSSDAEPPIDLEDIGART